MIVKYIRPCLNENIKAFNENPLYDHLYSPAALVNSSGTVLERYEYDAYGKCTFLTGDGNFTALDSQKSTKDNFYLFFCYLQSKRSITPSKKCPPSSTASANYHLL